MMRVRMFDLATAASAREGLLSVIDAGYNVLGAASYPTTLDLELAVSVEIDITDDDEGAEIDVRVGLSREDGESLDVGRYRRRGKVERGQLESSELNTIVIAFTAETGPLSLPSPGIYRFTLFDGEQPLTFIRFSAELVDAADLTGAPAEAVAR